MLKLKNINYSTQWLWLLLNRRTLSIISRQRHRLCSPPRPLVRRLRGWKWRCRRCKRRYIIEGMWLCLEWMRKEWWFIRWIRRRITWLKCRLLNLSTPLNSSTSNSTPQTNSSTSSPLPPFKSTSSNHPTSPTPRTKSSSSSSNPKTKYH